jgi:hypothetical protein
VVGCFLHPGTQTKTITNQNATAQILRMGCSFLKV